MSQTNPNDNPPPELQQLPYPPVAWLSKAAKRLYWTLQGPLSTAITVMPLDLNPDAPREAYFRQTLAGTTWHPISESPITEIPVASLSVTEENLMEWNNNFSTANQEGFDEIDDEPEGEPPEFEPLVVTASNGQFVTVHDYVTAVHPWLMAHKNQILKASNEDGYNDHEPEGNERLLVFLDKPSDITVHDEDEWKESLRWRFRNGRT